MKKLTTPILLSLVIISLLSSRAAADVAYSNLGPGDSFQEFTGLTISGPGTGSQQTIADAFTSLVTGTITSVDVGVFAGPDNINLSLLLNDATTNLPLVGSNIFLGTIAVPNAGTLVTLAPMISVSLIAGETYWLMLSPADNDTQAGWCTANDGKANPVASSFDGGKTFGPVSPGDANAFRINATPVPEPSVFALVGLAVIILLTECRSRSASVKIT